MSDKKVLTRQQRELARYRDTLVHAACGLIRTQDQEHLLPGAILQMHFDSRFKTIVTWHIPDLQGSPILPSHLTRAVAHNRFHYVIRRARTPMTYLWHRFKLGNLLYLRSIPRDEVLPLSRPLLSREYLFDPKMA